MLVPMSMHTCRNITHDNVNRVIVSTAAGWDHSLTECILLKHDNCSVPLNTINDVFLWSYEGQAIGVNMAMTQPSPYCHNW